MDRKQHIAIFTTASLPWLTGTAVNPLFRAAYLSKDGKNDVTLVIPWISLKDQGLVYPNNITFTSPVEQEKYVHCWLEERIGFASCFSIRFYPGKYSRDKRSIIGVGDISEAIPDEEADIAVLEEPEHLTWFYHGKRWKNKFRLVIGIIHTNYVEYVKRETEGRMQAFLLKHVNKWLVDIYCHKDYGGSIICNVHGVNPKCLAIGKKKMEQLQNGDLAFNKGAYYIGKMVWSKGYKELIKILIDHQKDVVGLEVDLFGSGEDSYEVREAVKNLDLIVRVHPARDHVDPIFHDYKLFLNPSTTDVVCTTTAEALAMGKIVVCANHPSNDFFKQFPNCKTYDDGNGFVKATAEALTENPALLTDAQRYELSWEAATKRFLEAVELDNHFVRKFSGSSSRDCMSASSYLQRKLQDTSACLHQVASGCEVFRRLFGAIPGSLQPDEELCKDLGLAIHS
ncbi:digalactosyldiacylglycerol synthase 2, chloroplastic-like isoform X2 [Prosopis cineraria]|uniref:digalactosyldiacylglycerol synthase 2, chloroplastic-like isoform X2 n=1 Tax=Prosopis cineraria TaxID=364024 RepID=UPI00240F729D|nr:digalactosyldiacylglycerol synthase 2, chloroplastic-like isoform X2 [Prosopis cineraria]